MIRAPPSGSGTRDLLETSIKNTKNNQNTCIINCGRFKDGKTNGVNVSMRLMKLIGDYVIITKAEKKWKSLDQYLTNTTRECSNSCSQNVG